MTNSTKHWLAALALIVPMGVGIANAPAARAEAAPATATTIKPSQAPRKTVAELTAALNGTPKPVVVDLRDEHDFAAGHITGAISVPFAQLHNWASHLDAATKARPIYFYCACHMEHSSAAAVATVHNAFGFPSAYALKDGWKAWVNAKGAVAKGPATSGAQPAGQTM